MKSAVLNPLIEDQSHARAYLKRHKVPNKKVTNPRKFDAQRWAKRNKNIFHEFLKISDDISGQDGTQGHRRAFLEVEHVTFFANTRMLQNQSTVLKCCERVYKSVLNSWELSILDQKERERN